MHSNTKIICTFGMSISKKETLIALYNAGMSIVRLNMSHGDIETHQSNINLIKEVEKEINAVIPIGLDTKGPELRISNLKKDIKVTKGSKVLISNKEITTLEVFFMIPLKNILGLEEGRSISVDDGCLLLEVTEKNDDYIVTEALNDHLVSPRKKVNIPGFPLEMPFLSEKDKEDILFGLRNKVDFIYASFVSNPKNIFEIKEFVRNNCDYNPLIISKVESEEAMGHLEGIIDLSDGIMIARGDLAVEIGHVKTFSAQIEITELCKKKGKLVICATQMLESMISCPVPTRAEITDIGNAVLSGVDCVMLSGETAKGSYPVECVTIMHKTCIESELILRKKESISKLKDVLFSYKPELIILETESLEDLNLLLKIDFLIPVFIKSKDDFLRRIVLGRKNVVSEIKQCSKILHLKNNNGIWVYEKVIE